jgi:hypothetical protein
LRYHSKENGKLYGMDECWNVYAPYIDVINSEEELIKFLEGEKLATSSHNFIKNINPNFPNVINTFKEFIEEITEENKI